MRRREGFTLVELMVTAAIMGVVMVYVLQTFTSQQRTYVVVDQVSEIQQNSRAVADLLERDLRHAGLMVPDAAALCGVDNTAGADLLYASDADAIVPGDDKNADFGATLSVSNVVGTATQVLTVGSLVVEPNPPWRPAYDTDGDSVNDSDFRVNAGVIVADRSDPARGSACGTVLAILSPTSIRVNIRSGALAPTAAVTNLVAVPAHEYQVNGQMQLLRDGMVLVEEVDDLQLAYFYDQNDNGNVDPGDYLGDDEVYDPGAVDASDLREARFNLVMRTRDPDPRQQYNQGQFQITENRNPVAGNDGFRRRVHTATVLLRNLGNRRASL